MTCGFRVWAPNAGSVHVTGPSCEWREREQPLAKEGGGGWATAARRVGASEPYRFVIQNGSQHWRVDAYARDVAQVAALSRSVFWLVLPSLALFLLLPVLLQRGYQFYFSLAASIGATIFVYLAAISLGRHLGLKL